MLALTTQFHWCQSIPSFSLRPFLVNNNKPIARLNKISDHVIDAINYLLSQFTKKSSKSVHWFPKLVETECDSHLEPSLCITIFLLPLCTYFPSVFPNVYVWMSSRLARLLPSLLPFNQRQRNLLISKPLSQTTEINHNIEVSNCWGVDA